VWILGYCNSSVEPNKSIKFGTDVVYDMGIHHIKFQLCYSISCVTAVAQTFAFLHTKV
jgi:hypothetical protein